jgi:RND family efflux transporter MFP subunit
MTTHTPPAGICLVEDRSEHSPLQLGLTLANTKERSTFPFRMTLAVLIAVLAYGLPSGVSAQALKAAPAQAVASAATSAFDGVVEAVRQTVVAAQVSGAVVQLSAKVGDRVKAGQVLLRIDSRAADQTTAAGDAQVLAARASLEVASKDFERQKQLYQKNYISQAALERAESEFKSMRAQASAQLAQASAARTQGGFYVVVAPYAGVIAEVSVSLGDMAMPGRPLVTLYDPAALRVTAAIPQSVASQMEPSLMPRVELPGMPSAEAWVTPSRVQLLPMVDAATHTVQLRADLPAATPGVASIVPGMFARLWLPVSLARAAAGTGPASTTPSVPMKAIVRRAEMTGLYVLDPNGKPVLRQVRLGRVDGEQVEILSGLMVGEQVVSDPQTAVRAR